MNAAEIEILAESLSGGWSYRLASNYYNGLATDVTICDVWWDKDGKPSGFGAAPEYPVGDTVEGVLASLDMMKDDIVNNPDPIIEIDRHSEESGRYRWLIGDDRDWHHWSDDA